VFKDARFERLGDISVGHLYNLRHSAPYRAQRVVLSKTRLTFRTSADAFARNYRTEVVGVRRV